VLQRLRHDDSGQLLVLILGFAVVAGLLVTVVTNASRVFLYQRALSSAADGAALAAAQSVDTAAIYRGGADETLPLDPAAVDAAVIDYLDAGGVAERLPGLAVAATGTDGTTVTVTLTARVDLAFLNAVSDQWSGGVPLRATARATSPLWTATAP
jgi:uncharacterized membrane protein